MRLLERVEEAPELAEEEEEEEEEKRMEEDEEEEEDAPGWQKCPICLCSTDGPPDDLPNETVVYMLPCLHKIHKVCFEDLLEAKRCNSNDLPCPICKMTPGQIRASEMALMATGQPLGSVTVEVDASPAADTVPAGSQDFGWPPLSPLSPSQLVVPGAVAKAKAKATPKPMPKATAQPTATPTPKAKAKAMSGPSSSSDSPWTSDVSIRSFWASSGVLQPPAGVSVPEAGVSEPPAGVSEPPASEPPADQPASGPQGKYKLLHQRARPTQAR